MTAHSIEETGKERRGGDERVGWGNERGLSASDTL